VQERGEGGRGQFVGERDEAGDVGLSRRLCITTAAARAKAQLGERIAVDEAPGGRAGGVVEEGPQRRDGAAVVAAL
jgi:hypothetical protein